MEIGLIQNEEDGMLVTDSIPMDVTCRKLPITQLLEHANIVATSCGLMSSWILPELDRV